MAAAFSLSFLTPLFLITALFARNAQAIIAKQHMERSPAVEVDPGQLPWLALLEIPDREYCTGTIVSPTAILSAALCLNGARNPGHGVAYAGNVEYTRPVDFEPPTQKRSIVEYHLYDENNPLIYNFMLVKIDPKWTWSRSVQPIGIIEQERLPMYFTPYCNVSGLGYGSNLEEDSKVVRSTDMWMGNWRVCLSSAQEHRMCTFDQDLRAPCVGDLGGSVLCDTEPEDKLYGIISEVGYSGREEQPDHCKIPGRASGFQFVGFYAPWIKKTAGDLPSAEEVKAIREQHEQDFLPARSAFKNQLRKKRGRDDEGEDAAGGGAAGGGGEETTTEGDGAESQLVSRRGLPLLALLAVGAAGVVY
ncbi:trypsin-1-like [Schistocerca gregaria]|uniref:trypsin-1-like n=1 Tax=Schistocerca gregaria TaxID=7010 RepID=UPI00211EA606|nr:trypsin-1-like [Schistocerca gregaria]